MNIVTSVSLLSTRSETITKRVAEKALSRLEANPHVIRIFADGFHFGFLHSDCLIAVEDGGRLRIFNAQLGKFVFVESFSNKAAGIMYEIVTEEITYIFFVRDLNYLEKLGAKGISKIVARRIKETR